MLVQVHSTRGKALEHTYDTSMYFVLYIRVVALLHKDPKDCMKKDQIYPVHVQNLASCFTPFRGML
jgi:hypothetical protein